MMGKLERFGEDVGLRKREKGLLGGLVMQDKSPALLRSVINHLQRFSVLCYLFDHNHSLSAAAVSTSCRFLSSAAASQRFSASLQRLLLLLLRLSEDPGGGFPQRNPTRMKPSRVTQWRNCLLFLQHTNKTECFVVLVYF